MGLSFADEPGKHSLPIVESIGERPQPQIIFVLAMLYADTAEAVCEKPDIQGAIDSRNLAGKRVWRDSNLPSSGITVP